MISNLKKFFLFFGLLSGLSVYAQDCNLLLQTAREYKASGDYKEAVNYYKKVWHGCGDYDGNVAKEMKECQSKIPVKTKSSHDYIPAVLSHGWQLNDTHAMFEADGGMDSHIELVCDVKWTVSGKYDWVSARRAGDNIVIECYPNTDARERSGVFYVMAFANDGTYTAEIKVHQEAGDGSYDYAPRTKDVVSVINFERGSSKPVFDNVRNFIKELGDNGSRGLLIEAVWCRNQYGIALVEERIRNIMDYFIASGINEDRITRKIILVDDETSATVCDRAYAKIEQRASDGQTWNEESEEMPGKKKMLPKDKVALRELVDVVSRTKILFDKGKDIPKIHDENDNLNKTVEIMKANPTFGLQIEGYVADDEGSEMEQRDLAQRRAYMVSKIFIEKGVPENQISTVTYTINDPRNSQNIPDVSKDEHRAAIFRILVN